MSRLALYGPGSTMLLAGLVALCIPDRRQYIAPFLTAGIVALALGLWVRYIESGRWRQP